MTDETFEIYAFTLRKTLNVKNSKQALTVIKRYHNIINYVKKTNPNLLFECTLECKPDEDITYNVHMHGMIAAPDNSNLDINIFPREKGMHIYIEPCKSFLAYDAYLARGEMTAEQIVQQIDAQNIIDYKSKNKIIYKEYKDETPIIKTRLV